jgi:hypothetical protein
LNGHGKLFELFIVIALDAEQAQVEAPAFAVVERTDDEWTVDL